MQCYFYHKILYTNVPNLQTQKTSKMIISVRFFINFVKNVKKKIKILLLEMVVLN